jgi:flagellar biosynthesis protein FlhF
MARIAGQYSVFNPRKLIFTRVDELVGKGDLASEAVRCCLPVSFLCGGQRIPDDLEPATQLRLGELASGVPATPEQRAWGATA